MAQSWAHTFGRRAARVAGAVTLVGGLLLLGVLGWQWRANATVGRVSVSGTQHAPADTLRRMARVDSGAVMSELDLAIVSDRVERHPWVEDAEVHARWMRRTLAIAVSERTPAGMAVDTRGRPAYYLDASGHAMPLPDSSGYNVPLVRGLSADYHPARTVAPPSVQHVFEAMSETKTESLVTEIELQPDSSVRLVTTPLEGYGSLPVRLGTGEVPHKLRTLRAFAEQVLPQRSAQSDASIEQIDLRFDGQVVTREHPPG